jgi:hypothetical protein
MSDARLAPLLQHIRRLSGPPAVEDAPDAILLKQLVSGESADALERLVRRHGPLVWRVCLRVLRREADAETEELRKLGWLAESALRKFLEGKPSLEARKRARELLDRAGKAELAPEALRVLRGMEVLERIGTEPAKRTLQTLAAGTLESRLTREAKASLQRLTANGPNSTSPQRKQG